MTHFFLNFQIDALIIFYILGGLLTVSFTKQAFKGSELFNFFQKKKIFYLLMRSAIFLMVGHFIYVFSTFPNYCLAPTYDSLSFFEFYQQIIQEELGNVFFRQDFLSLSFILILNLCVLFYLMLTLIYFQKSKPGMKYIGEFPILIITIFLSLKYFLLSYDFLMLIICLELASLCSVILLSLQLTTSLKTSLPIEAAIKYFLFNAVAVGFMLIAISGYYFFIQNFNFLDLGFQAILNPAFQLFNQESLLIFHFLFFFGYLMKLGSAPLHHWVPDVYEGVEFLLTAFLILIISPALNFKFFIFIKVLLPITEIYHYLFLFFLLVGFLSISIGVFSAIIQVKLKRFLAFASISHLGFILLAVGTPTYLGFFASIFYLLTYILTNITFFSFILIIQNFHRSTFIYLNQLKSLINYNYFYFFLFLIPLFSFAGFPPFAGFFGKLFVFSALLDTKHIFLSISLIGYIVINAYLYLRFIKIALFENHFYQLYIPISFTRISTRYQLQKNISFSSFGSSQDSSLIINNKRIFLYTLFLGNCILSLFLVFLPTVSLFCSQLIFNLFLFF